MRNIKKVLLLLIILFLFAGCTSTLKIKPKSTGTSVLYVSRSDAVFSTSHIVKVYLNGREATSLSKDGYKALHVKPGRYEIDYRAGKEEGKLESECKFTAEIEAGRVKLCALNYNFGWHCFEKLFDGEDIRIFSYANDEGEVDLTRIIAPK